MEPSIQGFLEANRVLQIRNYGESNEQENEILKLIYYGIAISEP